MRKKVCNYCARDWDSNKHMWCGFKSYPAVIWEPDVGIKDIIETYDLEKLRDICYQAVEFANAGQYQPGSNYWTTMVVDCLMERLQNKNK